MPRYRATSGSIDEPMARSMSTSSAGSLIRPSASEAMVIPSWAPASCIDTSERLARAAASTRLDRPVSSKLDRLAARTANS